MDIIVHYCPVMTPDKPTQLVIRQIPQLPRTGEFFRINKVAYLVEKVSWEVAFNPLAVEGPTINMTVNVFLQFIEDQVDK